MGEREKGRRAAETWIRVHPDDAGPGQAGLTTYSC